jgi:glycosyltransferase involved in cell wall biosynthesis
MKRPISSAAVPSGGTIRVMRIIARLNIGGPAIHVCLLTAGMKTDGFSSQLVTGHVGANEGDMSYLAREYAVEPVFVRGLGREISLVDDVRAFATLVRLMRRERPHVVHTHTAKAGFLGRLAAALCGVPVIVHTFHGHTFRGYFGPLKTRLFILLEQITARITDVILTISERLRADLVGFRIAPPDKIRVIPLGLDLDRLVHLDRAQGRLRHDLGIPVDSPLIGIVGRLVRIKNHDLFLQAAHIVAEQIPQARFVVVGDGDRRAELEAAVHQMALADKILFLGWRREIELVYADLDILALTSDNEGTPVSIIEAMAARVPVVATRVGGVPDVLQDGALGTLVEPGDPDSLASAMQQMIRSGKDVRQLEKAQAIALETYSSQRLIADLQQLYRAQLQRAAGSGEQEAQA